jgi:beta-mannosidase
MAQAVSTAPDLAEAASGVTFANWSCCALPPGAVTHPDQLPAVASAWLPAPVPGTVAEALQAGGRWDFSRPADLDADDWWYCTAFTAPDFPAGHPCYLCFDGLATLAEVWLNGQRLLTTDNMFRAYRVDVGPYLRPQNELVLGFRSLSEDLKKKRARPRWKTNLVNHQQLRWYRTSLLGRIPGWSPPAPALGPWRAVRLDTRPFALTDLRLLSRVEGDDGSVTLQARVHGSAPLGRVVLQAGGREAAAEVRADGDGWLLRAALRVPDAPLWWPHTHGCQPLSECALRLQVGQGWYTVPCGRIGFRELRVEQDDGFAVHVNGTPVYCRGACWTVSDVLTPGGTGETVARDLCLARDAGANMLRVGGTMVYESDEFYRLCDELGILVWQDFLFANMDYPVEDAAFAANSEAEAREQLGRLASHPCLAVLCGNSEVEQQAAMLGVPRDAWRNRWFGERLPELCAEYSPGVAYVPSTPSGGALPFHVREGVAHYYGVGAYLRSPRDLRQDDVKFSPECLAFANVPEPETVNAIMGGAAPAVHHPRWKERVPRDTGAGWDFDDVRDFYLEHFFGVDPVRLRSSDMARYLQLSRVVPGEMMAQVFAEWRGVHTRNRGGLVWFFKDLWPGPGWGIVDSFGLPKAVYYYLRRSWQPRQITLTDEGLDGLHLHVTNEAAEPLHGFVELLLLKDEHIVVARREVPCRVPPRARQTFDADAVLDGFYDLTHSYRFGPPKHDLAIATLFDDQHRVLSEAFYFVRPREPSYLPAVQLEVEAEAASEGCYQVALHCDHFLQSVSFDTKGFRPEDNYFHLPPSRRKVVPFRALGEKTVRFRVHLEALNLRNPVPIPLKEAPKP